VDLNINIYKVGVVDCHMIVFVGDTFLLSILYVV